MGWRMAGEMRVGKIDKRKKIGKQGGGREEEKRKEVNGKFQGWYKEKGMKGESIGRRKGQEEYEGW